MDDKEVKRLSNAIQAFIKQSGIVRARPKELMPHLIAEGFFRKDEKFGKPLRDVLNRLDREGKLDLMPQVKPERQEKAVYWYFEAVDMPEPKPAKAKKVAVKKAVVKPKAAAKKTTAPKKAAAPPKAAAKKPAAKKAAASANKAAKPAALKATKASK